ncbi:Hypothetical protein A7982_07377 [Minicystis rosea]|nr:Hypothetical protein A7982_07377 [Minicystis rosea]
MPAPDAAPPFPSDGVAGFGEAEPIEVCLGAARVVAPGASNEAGAVCVPEGAAGNGCSSNDSCEGIERCVCGRCIVEVCQSGSTCGDGRVCRDKRCTLACAADGDCPSGEACAAGGCARTCQGDTDCHFGERCDALANTCVAKPCSEAMACGSGRRCESIAVAGELHEPEVVTVGGAEVAYVEMRFAGASAGSAIYRAAIEAKTRWTMDPEAPVIPAENGERAGAPSVLVDGDRVEMYFAIGEGAGIARATSTDGGKSFVREAAPVLVPGAAWENGWIGSPAVVRFEGATYLLYEGGPRAGIGLARVDGSGAQRVSDEPIVTPASVRDPLFWREVTEVGAPYAMVAGGALRVYFTGRGVEGNDALVGDAPAPADPNDSIGLAASLDARAFAQSPTGPVFARLTNLRTYLGEREASVRIVDGSGASITFVATDATGQSVSGLARAGW